MIIKRYGIYLANLDPTADSEIRKTRPVVIVSDDMMNKHLGTVVACPLTTKLHPTWRSRLQTVCTGRAAEVADDQIHTLSKLRIIKKLDRLSQKDRMLLRQMITEMYGE